MRELLVAYVHTQNSKPPEERLTHLTTVLRYPPLPPGRGRPDPRAHLRFRLPDQLKRAALKQAFQLPGQSARHGHHDYASRPLTDVVMTAVELAEPIRLPGLHGLPSLLTRRTALGLWRLTVAATLTQAEMRAIWGGGPAPLVPVLTEEDVAWHHPWRFEVAEVLLRTIHDQSARDVAENMAMLHDQSTAFRDLLRDVRRRDFAASWLLDDLPHASSDTSGRGGAAVWRAHRKLTLEAIGTWATTPGAKRQIKALPPGWKLTLPKDWIIRAFGHNQPVSPALLKHAAMGAVARLEAGSRTAYWPLGFDERPIPGFNAVRDAGSHLPPARLLEITLHRLKYPHIAVPADQALELAFVSKVDHDELVRAATELNNQRVKNTLERGKSRLTPAEYAELAAASGNLRLFQRIAKYHYLPFHAKHPTWTWDVRSIPEALEAGHSPARLAWLTKAMDRITTRVLERDMQEASRRAFFLGRTEPDDADL